MYNSKKVIPIQAELRAKFIVPNIIFSIFQTAVQSMLVKQAHLVASFRAGVLF